VGSAALIVAANIDEWWNTREAGPNINQVVHRLS
jgi:hypothetical protein